MNPHGMRVLLWMVIAALLMAGGCSRGPRLDPLTVSATYVDRGLPKEEPVSPLWDQAAEHPARLMVQDVAEPRLTEPGVELVKVRALHDGEWIAFRLEWQDPTRDLIPESNLGSDAAAVQFPALPGAEVPDAAMGEKGKGVRIWYWKALWQDDAERAAAAKGDRIAALYPNASIDHYPFQAGGDARAEMEQRYAPAMAAGNPILARPGAGAVQVLMAEGFGNSTVTPMQAGAGRGVWQAGNWMTTIARPLDAGVGGAVLQTGTRAYVAFAVWDGAKRHTGSRKMRSGWIPLVLEAR